jgi:hypothetical protein
MLIVIIAPMIGRYTSRTSIGIHNTYIMCCRRHALVGALPFQIPSQILPQTTRPYYYQTRRSGRRNYWAAAVAGAGVGAMLATLPDAIAISGAIPAVDADVDAVVAIGAGG